MNSRLSHLLHSFSCLFALAMHSACAWSQSDHDWSELLRVLNDESVSFEAHFAAEKALFDVHDPAMLPVLFDMLVEPVGEWNSDLRVPSPGRNSSVPLWRQIPEARLRVFGHIARYARPEELRRSIFETLFDRATTELQIQYLVATARQNWTPDVRRRMMEVYLQQDMRPSIRDSAGWNILDMRHATPRGEFLLNQELIIATAWQERGTAFALRMSGRIGYRDDPRAAALRLDLYENERTKAQDRGQPISKNILDLVDAYFGNITGLYEQRRGSVSDRGFEIGRKRVALRIEANETGDDTKLRAFEAELAAKQQAELEERIEKIDAWIAANRDRLEAEAADFARQREEQRQRNEQRQREVPRQPGRD